MTPQPPAPVASIGDVACPPAAVPRSGKPIQTLCHRADFLRAARARRHAAPAFLLQARRREATEAVAPETVRIGYTCSKKVGNAVARNRAKRRLRALARAVLPAAARPGWDYVLVGRPQATATRDFALMQADLAEAIARLHADKGARR